jgi:hypothetical protein
MRHALLGCFATAAMLFAASMPAAAAPRAARPEPPWRIESFCHRPLPAARRCLVRARQGILVFRIAELPAPPRVSWRDGVAALRSGAAGQASVRFYVPPQTVSAAYAQVLDFDGTGRLVALREGTRVRLRRMFAPPAAPPLAELDVGAARPGSVRAELRGRHLLVRWREAGNRAVERSVDAPAS